MLSLRNILDETIPTRPVSAPSLLALQSNRALCSYVSIVLFLFGCIWCFFRYNSRTKCLEEREQEGGAKHVVSGDGGKAGLETDYVVVASSHVDPGVEVASDSGLEIDEVCRMDG